MEREGRAMQQQHNTTSTNDGSKQKGFHRQSKQEMRRKMERRVQWGGGQDEADKERQNGGKGAEPRYVPRNDAQRRSTVRSSSSKAAGKL